MFRYFFSISLCILVVCGLCSVSWVVMFSVFCILNKVFWTLNLLCLCQLWIQCFMLFVLSMFSVFLEMDLEFRVFLIFGACIRWTVCILFSAYFSLQSWNQYSVSGVQYPGYNQYSSSSVRYIPTSLTLELVFCI